MLLLWIGLAVFFAWRAFVYFRAGRGLAATLSSLGCLLFITSLVISQLPPAPGA